MEKRWKIKTADELNIEILHSSLKINKNICRVLASRNINTFIEAQNYFRPELKNIHNPFLMKGMQIAVDRILFAFANNQKILLYGDYDVDGTTSVAVVYQFLKHYYSAIDFYIPNRFSEGYGVSEAGVQFAIENKINLIITLDCGIKSTSLIQKAKDNGIDVIVADHHLPDENLPNAIAILNPKQIDCNYPYKELCGCGVGYKLICALEKTIADEQHLCNENLDLVVTAIAADIVPITGENRILAFYGLQKANSNPCIAIQALKIAADLKTEFTISDLVFIVAPRVNAAGRMDDAKLAVQLFLSSNLDDAKSLAALLNINNNDRKDTDKQMTAEALDMLLEIDDNVKATVLYKQDWHKGVVGIVASRMIEQRYQPTIILTESNGKISGSARSIAGFNLFEGLSKCADLLENFGGHYFAAGLTLQQKNLEAFKIKFNDEVKNILKSEDDFKPIIWIDTEIDFTEINENFYNIIHQMEPYGPENLRPVFITKNVYNFENKSEIVKENHLKLMIQQNGIVMKGIGFNLAKYYSIVNSNQPFAICYTIEPNNWNNATTLQLKVIDIKKDCGL